MSRLGASVACVALVTSTLAAHPTSGRQRAERDLSPKALAALATKYVTAYRAAFAFLVADEAYVQVVSDAGGFEQQRRTLLGELFLTYLEADHEWMAVHDFATVGGRPVPDREDLRALLRQGTTAPIMRRVASHNARFNIGAVERDFNEPTLALLVLEEQRIGNFSVGRKLVTQDGGTALAVLEFVERRRPTIVSSKVSGPVFSRGEITIETATGRVRRTRIAFQDGPILAELGTTYALEPKLDLWVPSVFSERYDVKDETSGAREVIMCEANYTNYRRFEVTGRIR